ncbi:MAG: hypothetical protein QOD29_1515 [Alphaproteobacteria bacterium]|nr:hypothetical protein [Alphaproteobacteria bacterium]
MVRRTSVATAACFTPTASHQQKDVLVTLVAEILGDRQRRQRYAPARPRRFIHLSGDEHRALENARRTHVEQHLMPFARALADAGKY